MPGPPDAAPLAHASGMLEGSAAYAAQSGIGTPAPMHTSCDWLFGKPVAVNADANIGNGNVPRNSPMPPRKMYGCPPKPPPAPPKPAAPSPPPRPPKPPP